MKYNEHTGNFFQSFHKVLLLKLYLLMTSTLTLSWDTLYTDVGRTPLAFLLLFLIWLWKKNLMLLYRVYMFHTRPYHFLKTFLILAPQFFFIVIDQNRKRKMKKGKFFASPVRAKEECFLAKKYGKPEFGHLIPFQSENRLFHWIPHPQKTPICRLTCKHWLSNTRDRAQKM